MGPLSLVRWKTSFLEMAVNLSTVSKWKKELNVLGEWLHYDEATEGKVNRIRCLLCSKHEDRLRSMRNYSTAFVHGITGRALKKDNVVKHLKSDKHKRAVSLEPQPTRTINEILRSTPIGRAQLLLRPRSLRIASAVCPPPPPPPPPQKKKPLRRSSCKR